jgi:hypothetical protein
MCSKSAILELSSLVADRKPIRKSGPSWRCRGSSETRKRWNRVAGILLQDALCEHLGTLAGHRNLFCSPRSCSMTSFENHYDFVQAISTIGYIISISTIWRSIHATIMLFRKNIFGGCPVPLNFIKMNDL